MFLSQLEDRKLFSFRLKSTGMTLSENGALSKEEDDWEGQQDEAVAGVGHAMTRKNNLENLKMIHNFF